MKIRGTSKLIFAFYIALATGTSLFGGARLHRQNEPEDLNAAQPHPPPATQPSSVEDRVPGATFNGAQAEVDGAFVHPAGELLKVPGHPVDIVFTPDGSLLFVKSGHTLTIVDVKTYKIVEQLAGQSGSDHGLAVTPDGTGWKVYFTTPGAFVMEALVEADGHAKWGRKIPLPGKHNWGIALSGDGAIAYVCMSVRNSLGIVDLAAGKVVGEIAVGIAPYDVVLAPDGKSAYVTNLGGEHPRAGQTTAKSAGTDVAVDHRSIPVSGSVSRVDLVAQKLTATIATGLHPTQLVRDAKGSRYFVANANSDSVSIIDARTNKVMDTVALQPDSALPFGSIPDALALSADEKTLYVANAGNDAVAVVPVAAGAKPQAAGFIPAGWFPGGICCLGNDIYIANTKSGNISRLPAPDAAQLQKFSAQVLADGQVPQILREMQRGQSNVAPVPVPAHPGEPSVFRHIVYILKENKTYDQVLGDIGKGNSEPKYCTFGQQVTPNHHALANQFVLLDNYYCNGVNSSDGHQWATQGMIGEYFEKGARTYDFGTDALCYANCDFIWDSCLLHGLSIRNYGEFDFPEITSGQKNWFDIYRDWDTPGAVTFKQSVELDTLMHYTCHEFPGWNLLFPDVCRAKVFLKELAGYEKAGNLPNFILLYLPQDHTAGTKQTTPTPRALVADNDLALGQCVEAISKSKFWKDTCIFINEDDPQSGVDHVDGHRSFCLIASPYTKRGVVVSHFYNQSSVLHTMTRILGLPPLNQNCALAPLMDDCFAGKADWAPYRMEQNLIALDEHNKPKQAMAPAQRDLAEAVSAMDFSRPDRANPDKLNRLIWLTSGRSDPYPVEFAGPHGKGLPALHLKLDKRDDDDED